MSLLLNCLKWDKILINEIVSIYNDLQIDGEYGMSKRKENRK